MTAIFITDDRAEYEQSRQTQRILYVNGFIGDCSFIDKAKLESFNNSLLALEDEASRLMLERLDEDFKNITENGIKFSSNKFIDRLTPSKKLHSLLFNSYKLFVYKKYYFQLVIDRFFAFLSISNPPLHLSLSEEYYLTQELPYNIISSSFRPAFKETYFKLLVKQVYYFFHKLFLNGPNPDNTQLAIFLFDIHNEVDVFRKFIDIAKKENNLDITLVVIESGNSQDKKADASIYKGDNVKVIQLYKQKANLLSNYHGLYEACKQINPLYGIFKKARLCETEDVQYGFINNAIEKLSPKVCMYLNSQELGRVLSNVCAYHQIPSVSVEYAFSFDSYHIEKRIGFDVRACMSEVTSQNWKKHKDPTARHEIIGFCKLDDWSEKTEQKRIAGKKGLFSNNDLTIFFASTWSPNPDSPLLTEKVQIVKELSEVCHRNGWNLIIKKHPSEFDNLLDGIFKNNEYPNQKIFEHSEMSLFDCVYYSDFVCTQNSTVFVEALYLNKPFSYISANGENTWAAMSMFSQEKAVKMWGSVNDYEQFIKDHSEISAYQKLAEDFLALQAKYLYKTDGKASERLMELAKSFIK